MATDYVAIGDVTALVPHVALSVMSKPSIGDVTDWIADVERECNAALGNLGIVVPVVKATSPLSWEIIRVKVAYAVVGRWLTSRALGAGSPDDQGANVATKLYDAWLKALADSNNPQCLPDAVTTGDVSEKHSAHFIGSHALGLSSVEFDPEPSVTIGQVM